jgi:hypothetical protein
MTERYAKNYRILGVPPDATWKQLRQAYKSLVNMWHPDRFQQDTRQRKLAEEKTKEIIQSYQELAEYYKKSGALPQVTKATKPPVTNDLSPQDAPDTHSVHASQDTEASSTVVTPPRARKSRRFKLTPRAIAGAALAGIAYLTWQVMPWERSDGLPPDENHSDQAADKQKNEEPNHRRSSDKKYFTFGTSLGEVYAIQGVPTKTEHDIWYYGSSKVYFAKGKVQRWEESPDNPLLTSINPWTEKMNAEFFSKGSSKKEVLAVQGAPDRDAGSVWDYGVSRVYFDNDRVKGWDESPLNPLRVQQ